VDANVRQKAMNASSEIVTFVQVSRGDFEELAGIRIAAMKESLERVGRFDPERAKVRLRNSFFPEHTRFIILGTVRAGFYALRPSDDGWHLDHLYVLPQFQGRGIGTTVMKEIFRDADSQRVSIFVGALKESASNRFYLRLGFSKTGENELDIYYRRVASGAIEG
jgi:ribosomal protein S18 acetylase RimI-like enzyme